MQAAVQNAPLNMNVLVRVFDYGIKDSYKCELRMLTLLEVVGNITIGKLDQILGEWATRTSSTMLKNLSTDRVFKHPGHPEFLESDNAKEVERAFTNRI